MRPAALLLLFSLAATAAENPTYYQDAAPILQRHCATCHQTGGIGPMPLQSYPQTRPWAKAIKEAVVRRKMPPWFADPRYGKFANDPSLTQAEIDVLARWADSGALAGPPVRVAESRAAGSDLFGFVLETPKAFDVPARGDVEYQYIVIPTGFREDKWVSRVEVRSTAPSVVHHAVVYIREPGSTWLRAAKSGVPYSIPEADPAHGALWTTSDLLLVYAPGNPPVQLPEEMAKLIPAGSDLVLQMHYTPDGKPHRDIERIALTFAKDGYVKKRVLSLQMGNDRFVIPPGHPHFCINATGTLPNDAELISLFPHMHLRGQSFDFNSTPPGGKRSIVLAVNHYDFHWQLSYRLADPLRLAAGTRLDWVACYDNSANNPRNPDPTEAVRYGEQSRAEMMIGFFDVAVARDTNKEKFFERR